MAMSVHGLVSAYRTITNGNSEKRMVCITYVAAVHSPPSNATGLIHGEPPDLHRTLHFNLW